jgi:hypothetical protein
LLPARGISRPRSMEERRIRGVEREEAVCRNHWSISRREAGVANLRSRVPTGTHSHLNTTPRTREKKVGLLGFWAETLAFWKGPGPLAVASTDPPTTESGSRH